jgi:hypothetical protein
VAHGPVEENPEGQLIVCAVAPVATRSAITNHLMCRMIIPGKD